MRVWFSVFSLLLLLLLSSSFSCFLVASVDADAAPEIEPLESSCVYVDSSKITHNLSLLTRDPADPYVMVAYKASRYLLNVCGSVKNCGDHEQDVGACFSAGPTSGTVLGSSNIFNLTEIPNPKEGQPPLAISIILEEGATCIKGRTFSTRINLFCDKDLPADNYTISLPGYNDCQYSFNLSSSLACVTPPPPPPLECGIDRFDFSRMTRKSGENEADFSIEVQNDGKYSLNICGPLISTPECSQGDVASCLVPPGGNPLNNGVASSMGWTLVDGQPQLVYEGPSCGIGRRTTLVSFTCDPTKTPGAVIGAQSSGCSTQIAMATKYAC